MDGLVVVPQFSHSPPCFPPASLDTVEHITFDTTEEKPTIVSFSTNTINTVFSEISAKKRKCSVDGNAACAIATTPTATTASMPWTCFMPQQWYKIYQSGRRDLTEFVCPTVEVVSDKGFEYMEDDDTWIYYRRNHIQLSVSIDHPEPSTAHFPHYIEIDGNFHHIEGFYVSIRGIKHLPSYAYITSAHDLEIEIYQTNSKREKKFERVPPPANVTLAGPGSRIIIPRLHFRRATANNARKNGALSKAQEFFRLVVTLSARCGDRDYPIVAKSSAPLIVRTGHPHSPHKFEFVATQQSPVMSISEPSPEVVEVVEHETKPPIKSWAHGNAENSIVFHGSVGINTEDPRYELSVNGNIACTGNFFQPSDRRIKSNIVPVDVSRSLDAINNIRLYDYMYSESWAAVTNKPPSLLDRGVLAQEVLEVLPHAVTTFGDKRLADGSLIDGLMVVNKDSLFTENIGATQALSQQVRALQEQAYRWACAEFETDQLKERVRQFEEMVSCPSAVNDTPTAYEVAVRIDSLEKAVANKQSMITTTPPHALTLL